MKRKKITTSLLILTIIIIPCFIIQTNQVQGYTSSAHQSMISCAIDLLGLRGYDDIQDYIEYTKFEGYNYNGDLVTISVEEILRNAQKFADDPNQDGWTWDDTKEHFWDPVTYKGMPFNNPATVLSEIKFREALTHYDNGEFFEAFIDFGWSLHLVMDLTVPYHCADGPWDAGCPPNEDEDVVCPHKAYENHIITRYGTYASYKPQWAAIRDNAQLDLTAKVDYDGDYTAQGWVHQAALVAYPYRAILENSEPLIDPVDDKILDNEASQEWNDTVDTLVPFCVSTTASFIHYIWQNIDTPNNDLGFNWDTVSNGPYGITYEDLDNDGLSTKDETLYCIDEKYGLDYTWQDTDSDGMLDIWEANYQTAVNARVADDQDDFDEDGLINLHEYYESTNPANPDTDYDDWEDGYECHTTGTNPNDIDSDDDRI